MRRTAALVLIPLGFALAIAAPVAAQTRRPAPPPARRAQPTDRIFIGVDGLFQAASTDFNNTVPFRRNAEDSSFSTAYDVKSGPAFNINGAGLVWRTLAIGVGVSRYSHSVPTAFSASVPNPFFFNQGRQVTGTINATREELAVHVQARGLLPLKNRRMQAMVFGGPSFFNIRQDVVNDFEITETYPYDSATFSRGVTNTVKKSKVGFNAGADVGYFFTRQVGVGGTIQYSAATMELAGPANTTMDVKAGGLQAGGGLRLRF